MSRPDALSTPHAWVLSDLGFPWPLGVSLITGVFPGIYLSWPNLDVQTTDDRCHIGLTLLPRTRRHILVIDIRRLFDTLAYTACRTQLTRLTITSSPRGLMTGRYTSPLVSSCNLFSEETKTSPMATYVKLGDRTWTVHRSVVPPHFFNLHTRGRING